MFDLGHMRLSFPRPVNLLVVGFRRITFVHGVLPDIPVEDVI